MSLHRSLTLRVPFCRRIGARRLLWARERLVLGRLAAAGVPTACVIGGGYMADIDALARRHAILHQVAAGLA